MDMNVTKQKDLVKNIVPAPKTIVSLAKVALPFMVGKAASSVVGSYTSGMAQFVPLVSNRTSSSLVTTVAMYAGYKMIKQKSAKEFLFYGAAGSSLTFLGSLAYDGLAMAGVQLPPVVASLAAAATGVAPVVSTKIEDNKGSQKADIDTSLSY